MPTAALVGAVLVGSGDASSAAAFDPATMCPSATPSVGQLTAVLADRLVATEVRAFAEGLLKTERTTEYTVAVRVDAGRRRISETPSEGPSRVFDSRTNTVYFEVDRVPGARDETDRALNTTLDWLGRSSVWRTEPGFQDILGFASDWIRLPQLPGDARDVTGCSVSGSTLTLTLPRGSTAPYTVTVTVDGSGAVLSYVYRDVRGAGQPDDVRSATLTYGTQNVAVPSGAVSPALWERYETSALTTKLAAVIVKAAAPKVKRATTRAARVRVLRVTAKSRVAAFSRLYWPDWRKISRVSVTNGVKVTVPGWADDGTAVLRVKGTKVTSQLDLP